MVLTQAQQHDAYREARDILKLGEKWQELMPGEKRPDFTRAAREVLKRALGHKIERNEQPLDIHEGEMHEHAPREAALVERYLRSGTVHPDALHSFQHNITKADPKPAPVTYDLGDDPELPDFDLYVHDAGQTIGPAGHYEPGKDVFHASEHEPDSHVPLLPAPKQPEQARLPSTYEAVH